MIHAFDRGILSCILFPPPRTFASLSEEVGVSEGTVRSIFRDYINQLEKTVRFEIPEWMGIDEIHLIKPRCVVSNIQNNTIVDILKDRNKATVTRYLSQLDGLDCSGKNKRHSLKTQLVIDKDNRRIICMNFCNGR